MMVRHTHTQTKYLVDIYINIVSIQFLKTYLPCKCDPILISINIFEVLAYRENNSSATKISERRALGIEQDI